MKRFLLSLIAVALFQQLCYSQNHEALIQNYLTDHSADLKLSTTDIKNWKVTSFHTAEKTGITHVYIRQTIDDLPISNATATFAIQDETVFLTGNRLVTNTQNTTTQKAKITALESIESACTILNIPDFEAPKLIEGTDTKMTYDKSNLSFEDIPVELVYTATEDGIKLAWEVGIAMKSADHWWILRIDAMTGEEIDRNDWVAECNLDGVQFSHKNHIYSEEVSTPLAPMPPPPPGTDQYNVFAIPVESPNHGGRSLVVGPYDINASPFGWHDTDGNAGAEFTTTRGNNVFAMEDENGNNGNGYSPDGGATLDFDFPLNMNQAATNYLDPAITNLFYMNNMMHDVWYHYGFDEASGNFQENNYGNGGAGSDYVNADAQDGSGMNNANFGTPPDGQNPRMQMFLWNNPGPLLLTVNAPSSLSGSYYAVEAGFGPGLTTTPITTDFVLYDDNVPDANDACEVPVNGPSMSGKIVVIRRGTCSFVDKVNRAQTEGAVAVIMVNNVAGAPFAMGGAGGGITIPSVMVSDIDGEAIIAEIEAGGTVNGTLVDGPAFDLDGDFDNGIVAHEYGHGISNRLTGGAANSSCLNNNEQMGEGWSDWFALMMTIEPGDIATDNRGIGTWVTGESTTGVGIRPAPYNVDFAVNNYTYANTNGGVSQPHGIGFVWCTMLWDITWDLIDQYGYDPDLYNGTGGNNIAMNLIIEGLKLQPCGPGFVDGRDAILQADQLLYGGENQCLLWNAFANRGLGFSASQGSPNNRSDQTEAFDVPGFITNVSTTVNEVTCGSYTWSANNQTYSTSGTYTEVLFTSTGCDSTVTLDLTITAPSNGPTQTISNCNTYTWATNGLTYTNSGIYADTTQNAQGCDSINTLDLTITMPSNGPTQTISNCGPYTWATNGLTYANSGVYLDTMQNAQGCDSINTLDLTIATSFATDQIVACGSHSWIDGNTYFADNNSATFILTNTAGCDSVVTLDLTVNPIYSQTETVSACTDYTWTTNGTTYTSSGMYTEFLSSSTGCDSTITLDLTISNVTSSTQTETACSSYTWPLNGTTYTAPGQYIETVTGQNGCDSVVTLDLTLTQPTSGTEIVSNCGSYTWAADGNTYANSGQYTTILTNSAGCDSTVTLDLTVLQASIPVTETVSICDSFTWAANGTTYTNSGIYSEMLVNAVGCDSSVTLDLTILPSYSATETINSCGNYVWPVDGQTYTTSGNYSASYTTVAGCDSSFVLDLTIEVVDASASMLDDVTLSANTSGATYQWIDCNNDFDAILGATNQDYSPASNGDYAVIVSSNNCYDTSECLAVTVIGLNEIAGTTVQLFPNPNHGEFTIDFGSEQQNIQVICRNALGQTISSQEISQSSSIDYNIEAATGIYFLEVKTDAIEKTILQVIKE